MRLPIIKSEYSMMTKYFERDILFQLVFQSFIGDEKKVIVFFTEECLWSYWPIATTEGWNTPNYSLDRWLSHKVHHLHWATIQDSSPFLFWQIYRELEIYSRWFSMSPTISLLLMYFHKVFEKLNEFWRNCKQNEIQFCLEPRMQHLQFEPTVSRY